MRCRDALTEAEAQAFGGELVHLLPLEIIEVSQQLLFETLAFSFREQVSPYDATFVVLARQSEVRADHRRWGPLAQGLGHVSWVNLL